MKTLNHYYVTAMASLLCGSTSIYAQNIDLAGLEAASIARITGNYPNSFPQPFAWPAGDSNNDGFSDILVASPIHQVSNFTRGRGNLLFGSASFTNLDTPVFDTSTVRGYYSSDNAAGTALWMAPVGDFNGDGFADHLVSTANLTTYLVFGKSTSANLNLSTLTTSQGIKIFGVADNGAGIGDINSDGFADIAIADTNFGLTAGTDEGRIYVIFGKSSPGNVTLSTFSGSAQNGFVITGPSSLSQVGQLVGSAGDFNKDGISDMVIGKKLSFRTSPDEPFLRCQNMVILGKSGFMPDINFTQYSPGTLPPDCFAVLSSFSAEFTFFNPGTPTTSRDFNGDGYSDLVITSPSASPDGATNAGMQYVIFGRDNSTTNVVVENLDSPGPDGFRIDGIPGERLGSAYSWVGDINGDSRADLAFSSALASNNSLVKSGSTYVIYGKTTVTATIDLASNFITGSDGFRIDGPRANPPLQPMVSAAGDVNADGIADLLVHHSISQGGFYKGETYLIPGSAPAAGITEWPLWN